MSANERIAQIGILVIYDAQSKKVTIGHPPIIYFSNSGASDSFRSSLRLI